MTIGSWFIVFLVFFGAFFLIYGLTQVFPSPKNKKTNSFIKTGKNSKDSYSTCPMCASILYSGEQLKSVVFPGTSDTRCHIFGCPHCYPFTEMHVDRICPVCKQIVPSEGFLIARMFKRKDDKKHVHIIGCSECSKRNRK